MDELIGFIRLWQMVVYQAIMDSVNHSKEQGEMYEKETAKWWLTRCNKDFYEVCYLANLDPNWIKKRAEEVIKLQKRVRREKGKAPNYLAKKIYRMKMEEKRAVMVNNFKQLEVNNNAF